MCSKNDCPIITERFLDQNGIEPFIANGENLYRKGEIKSLLASYLYEIYRAERDKREAAKEPGYIYVLSNPSFKDCIKIGRSRHGAKARAKQLGTSTPSDFFIEFEIYTMGASYIEAEVHKLLDEYRVDQSKEFFNCPISYAINQIMCVWNDINTSVSVAKKIGLPDDLVEQEKMDNRIIEKRLKLVG